MYKTKTTLMIAASLLACGTFASLDAGAREHSRSVQRSAHQGSVSVHRDNARFESQRQRDWQRDGEGNASMTRSRTITGANGGTAERQGSTERNADGSLTHENTNSVTNANGGTLQANGSFTRDADGNVSGSHDTTATNKNGATYEGSTTWSDGQVTHTGTCTNAAGATVDCPKRSTDGN
jgi:hypothetical protein